MPARAGLAAAAIFIVAIAAALIGGVQSNAQSGRFLAFTGPGVGYMEVPHDPSLVPLNRLTVEAWVYLNSYTGGYGGEADCPIIVGKGWSQSYALGLACGGDYIDAYLNGTEVFAELRLLPLRRWTHIAMTFDGATVRTYVNARPVAEAAVEGPVMATNDPLRVGHDAQWDRTFDGRVDDVRVWSVARSEAQLQAAMESVPPGAVGLVSRWTFENGTFDNAGDNDGVLVGDVAIGEVTPTPSPSPTASATPVPSPVPAGAKGDVDCDGFVRPADAGVLLAYLSDTGEIPVCPMIHLNGDVTGRLDVDCDLGLSASDALLILAHVVALEMTVPVGCPPIGSVVSPVPG